VLFYRVGRADAIVSARGLRIRRKDEGAADDN
jgi:hypothetical protein